MFPQFSIAQGILSASFATSPLARSNFWGKKILPENFPYPQHLSLDFTSERGEILSGHKSCSNQIQQLEIFYVLYFFLVLIYFCDTILMWEIVPSNFTAVSSLCVCHEKVIVAGFAESCQKALFMVLSKFSGFGSFKQHLAVKANMKIWFSGFLTHIHPSDSNFIAWSDTSFSFFRPERFIWKNFSFQVQKSGSQGSRNEHFIVGESVWNSSLGYTSAALLEPCTHRCVTAKSCTANLNILGNFQWQGWKFIIPGPWGFASSFRHLWPSLSWAQDTA